MPPAPARAASRRTVGNWRAGFCGLAFLLAGCIEQDTAYRFDGAGRVEIDSVLRLDPELLAGMPEDEVREFVSEALFGELGDRRIERTGDGWRSRGPAVPVTSLAALLAEQGVRFEQVAGGWRFVSEAGDMLPSIRAEVRDTCRSEAPGAGVADFCEQIVGMLVDPAAEVRPDMLPAELLADLGMSREELAGTLMVMRSQLAKVTLRLDLHGPVRDVVGFAPLPGGGWTFTGKFYDLLGQSFAWTVPGPSEPAGEQDADSAPPPEGAAGRTAWPAGRLPTPEVRTLEDVSGEDGSEVAYVLRAPFGDGGDMLGVVLTCMPGGALQGATYFGGYPPDGRPVQLAVRAADGRIERFGQVERGTPASGFHAPMLNHPAEAWRFAEAALGDGALISNGYRSLWNRAGPASNQSAQLRLRDCMRK